MDDSMGNPGLAGNDLPQVSSSVSTVGRSTQVTPQRPGVTAVSAQKPDVPAETRPTKASKDFVEEVA